VSDELIATELIFENVLTPLSPAEIVSVMSCLIFEEKDENEPTLTGKKIRQKYIIKLCKFICV
jgi:superfamily II RNA helicase